MGGLKRGRTWIIKLIYSQLKYHFSKYYTYIIYISWIACRENVWMDGSGDHVEVL